MDINVLNQPVLVLNQLWQPITPMNVKEAFVAMLGGKDGNKPPAMAIDQEFATNEDGEIDWSNMVYANPVPWETWVTLPVRSFDLAIHTSKATIRVPRVIVQPNYAKMPMVSPKPTKNAIRKRDGGIDQYTGKPLSWKESNIDHVIPRDLGGKNTFENMVLTSREINSLKANKTPEQAGLRLIRKPFAPKSRPLSTTQTVAHHPSWIPFMIHVTEVRGK